MNSSLASTACAALAGRQWIEVLDQADEVWLPGARRALSRLGLPANDAATPAHLVSSATRAVASTAEPKPVGGPRPEPALHGLARRAPLVGRGEPLAYVQAAWDMSGKPPPSGWERPFTGGRGAGHPRLD